MRASNSAGVIESNVYEFTGLVVIIFFVLVTFVRVGVSQKAIDYWERSVNEPKASYIIALVQVFNISYDEFFENINS